MNNQHDELPNMNNELTNINVKLTHDNHPELININTPTGNYPEELNLLTLPNEILAHILFFLTVARNQVCLARTCSFLNNIFSLITRVQFISTKNLCLVGPILARYVNVKHLYL